ncbi:MAG: YdcF family protein [Bdellovibrio sp.]|nr:MAG: YdcF family protein [Bdellovibrio sp.]
MVIGIVLVLLLVSAVTLWFRDYTLSLGLMLLTILIFVTVGCGFLPDWGLAQLQTSHHLTHPIWQKKNAIIVLGLGTVHWSPQGEVTTQPLGYPRVFEAARLYRSCKHDVQGADGCTVILSGGDPSHTGTSEARMMANELQDLGLPANDFLLEEKSRNTFENARFSCELIKTKNFDHLLVVSSNLHVRRASLFFTHFGCAAHPAPADQWEASISFLPLAKNFSLLDMVMHEYQGLAQFYLFNFLGWNPKGAPEAKGKGSLDLSNRSN